MGNEMNVNIEELRRLASEAHAEKGAARSYVMLESEWRFFAKTQPSTILALLDDLERLKAQRDAYLNLLSDVAYEVESLISESYGIAGLHMNGDIAPWHEIEAGGRYERLTDLPLAIEAARTDKELQP